MKRNGKQNGSAEPSEIRCAIYTRKSTDEGLDLEFNSLDAQRDSAEAYIASQREQRWVVLPRRYDDGGFSGGNLERPALKQLMADIEAGLVDCVVVYKVDRLSRSLLDFSRLMETFDRHGISFVSVTQQFNTTHSMGRLTLNILLSFAQFEREIISERTRDKIAAARRKGKWAGGRPLLGYDIVSGPGGSKLVVNEEEAKRVRAIFELFLEYGSLTAAVEELSRRSWRNKQWTTKKGRAMGGRPFDKPALYRLLRSVVYLGKVTHAERTYDGEHEPIVSKDLFNKAQAMLRRNKHSGGKHVRNKNNALLKGLVRCAACGVSMSHHFTTKNGIARYRYYVCMNAQKRGWSSCPCPSVPAGALEGFVIEQLREVGRTSEAFRDVLYAAQEQIADAIAALKSERTVVEQRVQATHEQMRGIVADPGGNGDGAAHLAALQDELREAEQEATRVGSEIIEFERKLVDEAEIAKAIEAFDPVWDSLSPAEQARLVQLLVEQIDYDGKNETVSVIFRSGAMAQAAEPEEVAT